MQRASFRLVRLGVVGPVALLCAITGGRLAYAAYSDISSLGASAFTTDTLNAPTGLAATGGASVTLNWSVTADAYAQGYNVLRGTATGGPYTQITQVTPRTATTYLDSPAPGTYYYVLQSYAQSWTSANSTQTTAGVSTNTGLKDCTANAAVTVTAGDNNGFQLNPGNACADDGAVAEDTDSGTNTNTACTNTGKDKHLYYDYGISITASSVINGIEVRLEGMADATTGAPRFCGELSWNGGTSWTTAKFMSVNLTTTEATYTLGAANDTWGRTWSPADFTNANFRVRITSRASNAARDLRLERAAVRVTYTPP